MFFEKLIEDTIINGLREGNPEVVRRLQTMGYTPFWSIGQLVDEAGEPVTVVDSEKPLPAHCRMERFSLWHWSHRAATHEGVECWWPTLERKLGSKTEGAPGQVLASHVTDAVLASALSNETEATLYTWDRALRQKLPLWERKVMVNQLLNVMETQGNRLVPLLQVLHAQQRLTAADWTVAQRQTYAADPVQFLFNNRAWDALHVLLSGGAEPTLLTGETLVNRTLALLDTHAETVDPGMTRLLGTLLAQHPDRLAPAQEQRLNALAQRLETAETDPELVSHLIASRRAQSAQTQPAPPAAARRRQRT